MRKTGYSCILFPTPISVNCQGHLSIWDRVWLHSFESRWQSKWRSDCLVVFSLKGLKNCKAFVCVWFTFSSWNPVFIEWQGIKPLSRCCADVMSTCWAGALFPSSAGIKQVFLNMGGTWTFNMVIFSVSSQSETKILCFCVCRLRQLGWQVTALKNKNIKRTLLCPEFCNVIYPIYPYTCGF